MFTQKQIVKTATKGVKKAMTAPLRAAGVPSGVRSHASSVIFEQALCQKQPATTSPVRKNGAQESRTRVTAGIDIPIPQTGFVARVSAKGTSEEYKMKPRVSLKTGNENKVYVKASHDRKIGDNIYIQSGVEAQYRNRKPEASINGGVKINY